MFHCTTILCKLNLNRGRISSVSRVLDCRVGGHKFNSRGRTNTHRTRFQASSGNSDSANWPGYEAGKSYGVQPSPQKRRTVRPRF